MSYQRSQPFHLPNPLQFYDRSCLELGVDVVEDRLNVFIRGVVGVYCLHTFLHYAIDVATELALFEEDGEVSYTGEWGDSDERFGLADDYCWIHIQDTLGEEKWKRIGCAKEWASDKSGHPI